MSTQVTCSICSVTLRVRAELAGKQVKCPNCEALIAVPSQCTDNDDQETTSSVPRWLIFGAAFLVFLASAVAGGFVFGHRQGKSDDRRDLAEAQAQSKLLADQLKAAELNVIGIQAERDNLAAAVQERENKLVAAKQREDAAIARARIAEDKLVAGAAAEADALTRRREEEARKVEDAKKVQAARNNPTKVLFKDFANFPEEYAAGCVRFDNVWLDGDFDRVEGSRDFSPGVSSPDGKHIFGRKLLRFADGAVFVISEEIGRPLSVAFESNKKYGVNLCCEVTKNGKLCLARIYRVETLTVGGSVKDVFQEK